MNIVEQARADHLANAGAGQGGPTAEFLRANEPVEGGELIDQLSQSQEAANKDLPKERQRGAAAAAAAQTRAADSVLDELMADKKSTEATPAATEKSTKAEKPPEQVDSSVIDGLLGDEPDEDSSRESKD